MCRSVYLALTISITVHSILSEEKKYTTFSESLLNNCNNFPFHRILLNSTITTVNYQLFNKMSQQKHIHIHVFFKTDLHLTELLSNTYSSVQNKFTCSYSMAV